jgi:hypothetical protein
MRSPSEKFGEARPIQFAVDATALRSRDFPEETGFRGRVEGALGTRRAVSGPSMGDVRTATKLAARFPGGGRFETWLRLRALAFRVRRLIRSA